MQAFEKFDKNKDGSLGLKEVQRLVEALNVKMSPGQVKKKFKVRKKKEIFQPICVNLSVNIFYGEDYNFNFKGAISVYIALVEMLTFSILP